MKVILLPTQCLNGGPPFAGMPQTAGPGERVDRWDHQSIALEPAPSTGCRCQVELTYLDALTCAKSFLLPALVAQT